MTTEGESSHGGHGGHRGFLGGYLKMSFVAVGRERGGSTGAQMQLTTSASHEPKNLHALRASLPSFLSPQLASAST
jgi:hypothetical protein